MLIASLPMYDWPENRDDTDALWQHYRPIFHQSGLDAPPSLTRSADPMDDWRNPALLFSQTCGFPYVMKLTGSVRILGTPRYAVSGCHGNRYASRFVVHRRAAGDCLESFAATHFAFNDASSQSGFNAMRLTLHEKQLATDFFSGTLRTGSHRGSARAVAAGKADICALDPVSWALIKRHDRAIASQLKVIDESVAVPTLPYVCARPIADRLDSDRICRLLQQRAAELPGTLRQRVWIQGLDYLTGDDYLPIRQKTRAALDQGYANLSM